MEICSPRKTTLGFIGTGVMGAPMASHLLKAGYRLYVHNRTASRAQASVDAGAIYCDTPGEVAAKALFDKVAREGFEENGTQVVIKAYGSWQ